jgi:hypothetical protein
MLSLSTVPEFGMATVTPTMTPITLSGTARGTVPAADFFGTTCYGSINPAPAHRLVVTEGALVEVVARPTAGYSDMVLAIQGGGVSVCSDDYDGVNPGIRRYLAPGEYAVYVGELSPTGIGTAFTTTVTGTAGTPPPDIASMASGLFGTATVGLSYGTTTLGGNSGGPNRADTLDMSCRGYISEQPSFIMDVTDESYMSVRVMSQGDTTLVVMGPDGTFCNDDFSGLNPGLEQYFTPGRYGVWVGSYSPDGSHPFMITFGPSGGS